MSGAKTTPPDLQKALQTPIWDSSGKKHQKKERKTKPTMKPDGKGDPEHEGAANAVASCSFCINPFDDTGGEETN